MLKWILTKIVGSKNQREIKRLQPVVEKINEIEKGLQSISDDELRQKTIEWQQYLHRLLPLDLPTKRQLQNASPEALNEIAANLSARFKSLREDFPSLPANVEPNYESIETAKLAFRDLEDKFREKRDAYLEEILPEAFAVVKSGARRICGLKADIGGTEQEWNMVHFDVQLVGGIALHRGIIAEMQTGEGKTLVATLPVYLNALTGCGVHVVTVNDYLALRDSTWMGNLFTFLGLSVGCIQNQMPSELRRAQYQRDITYGTNAEFGFDYLRDNGMANSRGEQVQRGHYYSVIDEVDSVLIDEARTPLIISGPAVVTREQQFDNFKGAVNELVRAQNQMINELVNEAQNDLKAGDPEEAGRKIFKVKLGQPRNRQLMRMMEDPELRRVLERTELAMYQDSRKKDLFAAKEELYFTVDEKAHDADLMDKGREFLSPEDPESFTLPDIGTAFAEIDADPELDATQRQEEKEKISTQLEVQGERVHAISQLLKAYCLYEKDVEYVVSGGKVVIIDQNTGREMPGRRWSDGLHQAVEAKENCEVEGETQTYATITIQNYFRLYEKLSGMTGTAETEAAEFHDIYSLDVLPIPTNRPNQRIDHNDQIFKSRREKFESVIQRIGEIHETGQPLLIGTASVEASETLSRMLSRAKIKHEVLNAKNHAREADIVSQAGQRGAVTVSTNMAGRGTDIKLGEGVAELGGLMVVGTERYESRRIDRQLRGRCARQGDPGGTQFFISFEDDLMRNFGAAERMTKMMERLGMEDGEALEHSWLNKSVETAQKRVEQRNYMGRKRVLDFDDVMNQQREVVYGYRNEILSSEDPREELMEVIEKAVPKKVHDFLEGDEEPDVSGLLYWINVHFPLNLAAEDPLFAEEDPEKVSEQLIEKIKEAYLLKAEHEMPEMLDHLERSIALAAIDRLWQEHLYNMDGLREGVSLRAQGQKDPLVEYKNDAYKMFVELMDNIDFEILHGLFRSATSADAFEQFLRSLPQNYSGGEEALTQKPKKPAKPIELPRRKPTVDIKRKKKAEAAVDAEPADESSED